MSRVAKQSEGLKALDNQSVAEYNLKKKEITFLVYLNGMATIVTFILMKVPLEKRHIHIRKGVNVAKYFIEPEICLASSWGMSSRELNELEKQVEKNKELIRRKWDEYFNKRSSGNQNMV